MMKRLKYGFFIWALFTGSAVFSAGGVVDFIQFGDADSEQAHQMEPVLSEIVDGALDVKARRLLPEDEANWRGGKLTFKMKVDPEKPNYFTVKFWGGDKAEAEGYEARLCLYVEGKQLGTRHLGMVDMLDIMQYGKARYPGRFIYTTRPLPIHLTQGKTEVEITIEGQGGINGYAPKIEQFQKMMTEPSRGIYRAYVHTHSCFQPSEKEVQGAPPVNLPIRTEPGIELIDQLKAELNELSDQEMARVGKKHELNIQYMARAYTTPWNTAYKNPKALERIVEAVDAHYLKFKASEKITGKRWFFLGPIGDALRLTADDLNPWLNEKIPETETVRRTAWCDLMEASRNHNSSVAGEARRSFSNQCMIKDLNTYYCNLALHKMGSSKAWPEKVARRMLYEAVGLEPFSGSWDANGTGKSAIIEIFDYCFGSSENTIPKGIITDCAAIYFSIMQINDNTVVIARDPVRASKGFYKLVADKDFSAENIDSEYFDEAHFIPLDSFKKRLRSDFLDIDDVDESITARENRGSKSPTPSIRSFTSFMLQHQNLVANKHALFYRFDEKEKRDQLIDHTKIFLGIVQQEYFHLKQKLEMLKASEKAMRLEVERSKKQTERLKERVEPLMLALSAEAGLSEPPVSISDILTHPLDAKERLDKAIRPEAINPLSDAHFLRFNQLEQKISQKTAEMRRSQTRVGSIQKSIKRAESFSDTTQLLEVVSSAQVAQSVCPFCHTTNDGLRQSAETLKAAIEKVGADLSHAPLMSASLRSSQEKASVELQYLKTEISELMQQQDKMKQQNKELASRHTLYETVLKLKAELCLLLEKIAEPVTADVDNKLKILQGDIGDVERDLKKYNVSGGLKAASRAVNGFMAEIGQKFDFEEGYMPINLKFSFETFDLYHQTADEKVYLRSMGSGANWLYSHVTLFLAMHRYFASLKDVCSIPSVLFFDQPTQVYFPSFKLDRDEEFSAKKIEDIEKRSADERQVDDDVKSVENLFSQLSIFCKETEEQTGIMPQIIVSDHADHLSLSDGTDFETLVNGNRWRTRGLIHSKEVEG